MSAETVDIDALERQIVDRDGLTFAFVDPADILTLIAEVRRLRLQVHDLVSDMVDVEDDFKLTGADDER